MSKKRLILVVFVIAILSSLPVYSQGYESINVFKSMGKLIFLIIIFIAMIFLTFYGTKLIAKNAGGMAKSKYIQLIDAINVTSGSKIVIAKINGKFYVLSVNNNGSKLIDTIDEDDFPLVEDNFDGFMDTDFIKNKLTNSKINKNTKLFYKKHINKITKNKEDIDDE